MNRFEKRAQILFGYGASVTVAEALLAYSQPVDEVVVRDAARAALVPELHLLAWQDYAVEAERIGVFRALQQRLPQLRFPIYKGVSQSELYLGATRLGKDFDGGGLRLEHPDTLQLRFHQTVAGTIPVLIPHGRHDFVALVRAFTAKNEPAAIPDSMGAGIIFGYVNWDRIHTLRREWEENNGYPPVFADAYWKEEWREHIAPYKALYQDTFIILSDGDYSGIPAAEMGRPTEGWREASLRIRQEHEGLHYVMRRLLAERPSPIIEEMLADMSGIVAVWDTYHAEDFLRFVGLEDFPNYREGGRLDLYRGTPALSDAAFTILCALVRDAAMHLETLYTANRDYWATEAGQVELTLALSSLTIEELAAADYAEAMANALRLVGGAALHTVTLPPPLVSAGL